jgi:hypothetical protein
VWLTDLEQHLVIPGMTLEKVDAEVFLALSNRVPKHREFDRTKIFDCGHFDLVVTGQRFVWLIAMADRFAVSGVELESDARLAHGPSPLLRAGSFVGGPLPSG